MKKIVFLLLLIPCLISCSENVEPTGEQEAYYWVSVNGGFIPGIWEQYFVDGNGQLVEVPVVDSSFQWPPLGGGQLSWGVEALRNNLQLDDNIRTDIPGRSYRRLINNLPENSGVKRTGNEIDCVDGRTAAFFALVKNEMGDHEIYYLGSRSLCDGNVWEIHKSEEGQEALERLDKLIFQ